MANGVVIGSSDNTGTPPTTYWSGTSFQTEIDAALFFDSIAVARAQAGSLQVTYTSDHIESYAVIKTVSHNPPLGTAGI